MVLSWTMLLARVKTRWAAVQHPSVRLEAVRPGNGHPPRPCRGNPSGPRIPLPPSACPTTTASAVVVHVRMLMLLGRMWVRAGRRDRRIFLRGFASVHLGGFASVHRRGFASGQRPFVYLEHSMRNENCGTGPRLHYRLLTLCPAPTDPVGQSWRLTATPCCAVALLAVCPNTALFFSTSPPSTPALSFSLFRVHVHTAGPQNSSCESATRQSRDTWGVSTLSMFKTGKNDENRRTCSCSCSDQQSALLASATGYFGAPTN